MATKWPTNLRWNRHRDRTQRKQGHRRAALTFISEVQTIAPALTMGLWGLSIKQKCKYSAALSLYKNTKEWEWNTCGDYTTNTADKNKALTGLRPIKGSRRQSHRTANQLISTVAGIGVSSVVLQWCGGVGHPQDMTAHFCFSGCCATSNQGGIFNPQKPPPERLIKAKRLTLFV